MLTKTLIGVGLFAAGGAAIGYSQILCFNGECAMTGTPYGGALFGGALGLAIMSGINSGVTPTQPVADPLESDSDDETAQ